MIHHVVGGHNVEMSKIRRDEKVEKEDLLKGSPKEVLSSFCDSL
jgi:hypothetical protein